MIAPVQRCQPTTAEALRLLQEASCFGHEVCPSLPCHCAETLAAMAAAPPRVSPGTASAHVKIEHPHRPYEADYEYGDLQRRIKTMGGPEAVVSILQQYAFAAPRQGSYAGSLWAIAEWLSEMLPRISGVAQRPQVPCPVCGGEAIHALDVLKRTIIREPIAWDANDNRSYEPVETMAAEIYGGFIYDGPAGTTKPRWAPGGNSTKQDEARFEARRRLSAAGHTPSVSSTDQPPPKVWLEAKAERDAGWHEYDDSVSAADVRGILATQGEIKPHIYSPDIQTMGDCRVCGHGQDKPWHSIPPAHQNTPHPQEK